MEELENWIVAIFSESQLTSLLEMMPKLFPHVKVNVGQTHDVRVGHGCGSRRTRKRLQTVINSVYGEMVGGEMSERRSWQVI